MRKKAIVISMHVDNKWECWYVHYKVSVDEDGWHAELHARYVNDCVTKCGLENTSDLSSRYRTNRAIGRPRKRWEDDINDFLKQILEEKEIEEPIEKKGFRTTIIGST